MKTKILVVSQTPTHPTIAGNRRCQLDYTCILKELGYEVWFLYIQNDFGTENDYLKTKEYWGDTFLYFKNNNFYKWRRLVINKYRKVFCNYYFKVDDYYVWGLRVYINKLNKKLKFHSIIINYVWLSRCFNKLDISNKILFTHDCFVHKSLKVGINVFSMKPTEESNGLQRCPKILAIQDNESVLFKYLAPKSMVYTVYSPFTFNDIPITENKNLLLISGPNEFNLRGTIWFIKKVMPLIMENNPSIKLIIGGSICEKLKDVNISTNVRLLGIIEDVSLFYSLGNIAINPIFQGTGLKIKTFEALSYGRTTVVHPHSTEGLFNRDNAPLFIAKNEFDFCDFIVKHIDKITFFNQNKEKAREYINNLNEHIKKEFTNCIEH
jgi:hypothetical protein